MHMITIIIPFFVLLYLVQTLLALGMIFTCCCCLCCCCFCCGKCGASEHEENFQYMDPDELAAEEENGGESCVQVWRLQSFPVSILGLLKGVVHPKNSPSSHPRYI